ncbi:hypothetical protein CSV77_14745 [Sporosarcina sp. P16b]|uniref:hypothetical protein n=1 Tax=Sporosarcina sp. P16b TaxID=2048261 RepID=UPI000C1706F5|nr:hypothetical protein [Sporosarcina sp. P16b]PIC69192.1 hypothetical protein CSV77_14745 [Sporosarcina sp. P16b]
MSEIIKAIPVDKMTEAGVEVGRALGDAIRKNPKESLAVALFLGSLYVLKDKKLKLKLKVKDIDIDFEAE